MVEILVVEEDGVLLDTLSYNLRRRGFGVNKATTGAQALSLARGLRPDLVLLDERLPDESGLEVCERIREHDRAVVIILVSTQDNEEGRAHGFLAGANDYITKPFGVDELAARVKASLRHTRHARCGAMVELGSP